jgi:hypothetical protein
MVSIIKLTIEKQHKKRAWSDLCKIISNSGHLWFYHFLVLFIFNSCGRHIVGYLRSERFGKDVYFMILFSIFSELTWKTSKSIRTASFLDHFQPEIYEYVFGVLASLPGGGFVNTVMNRQCHTSRKFTDLLNDYELFK